MLVSIEKKDNVYIKFNIHKNFFNLNIDDFISRRKQLLTKNIGTYFNVSMFGKRIRINFTDYNKNSNTLNILISDELGYRTTFFIEGTKELLLCKKHLTKTIFYKFPNKKTRDSNFKTIDFYLNKLNKIFKEEIQLEFIFED